MDADAGIDEAVGEEIQHLRVSLGMSQADLGNIVGVTQHQIQSYESGRTGLSIQRLCRIADALGKQPDHFLRVRRFPAGTETLSSTLASDVIGLVSKEDLDLAAKIARIRDVASQRDILSSIDRLVDAKLQAQESPAASV